MACVSMVTTVRPPTSLTRRAATPLSSPPQFCHIACWRPSLQCSANHLHNHATVAAAAAQGLLVHNYRGVVFLKEHAGSLLASLVPVGVAMLGCRIMGIKVLKEFAVAVTRSAAQLLVLASSLKFVFDGEKTLASVIAVVSMVLVAGYTAGGRAKDLPQGHLIATFSLAVGTLGVLAMMVFLKVCPWTPRYIVPTAGYVIGNSMSMVGATMHGLKKDILHHRGQIETALALGASPEQAVVSYTQRAVAQAMAPWIDSIKAAGLITIPGSMAGMLMVGLRPMEVVQIQLQLLYMLLGASALSSAMSSYFGSRVLFSKSHQLNSE